MAAAQSSSSLVAEPCQRPGLCKEGVSKTLTRCCGEKGRLGLGKPVACWSIRYGVFEKMGRQILAAFHEDRRDPSDRGDLGREWDVGRSLAAAIVSQIEAGWAAGGRGKAFLPQSGILSPGGL